ncbi:glutathione S-transferase family protein [Nisaea sediminum]|uniref:glutathione S-transferase family protein n=1 Tax=Nisaea sediminum TaxID=2775867 RepID=UPI001865FE5E|nr:glutathione S-transferase family protein [Nisaea sediminum]
MKIIPSTAPELPSSGLHLFHFGTSSCSQKLRIALRMKGVSWTGHIVDLSAHENYGADFLALNPRGMVPVLVLDGAVHVESNDILMLLEERFPEPCLFPAPQREEISALLAEEDALHHDLRRLSFRFVHGRSGTTKTPELMRAYREGGPTDAKKEAEIAFYERLAETGLDEETCSASAERFRAAFDRFEARLADHPFLIGDQLTVIDIAWFVYAYRLTAGGYPLKELHPRIHAWFEARREMPGWEEEVALPPVVVERAAAALARDRAKGSTLAALLGAPGSG